MSDNNILIIGATGWIGTYITAQILLAKENFGTISIFTSTSTLERKKDVIDDLKRQGVEIIVGDILNLEDVRRAFEGKNTIISSLGRSMISTQISWLPLLSSSPSIKRFLPSEYGTDIEYAPSSANEPPHQQKLAVRAALAKANPQNHTYTYIVTGPFAYGYLAKNSREEIGSFDVLGKKASVIGDGKGRISLTTEDDVGRFVVAALLHPEAGKNSALKLNSFTTTPLSIVQEFEKQTGDKWDLRYVSLESVKEGERKAYEEGVPWATGYTLRRIWAEGGTLYEERDNGKIGAEGTDTLELAVGVEIGKQRR